MKLTISGTETSASPMRTGGVEVFCAELYKNYFFYGNYGANAIYYNSVNKKWRKMRLWR